MTRDWVSISCVLPSYIQVHGTPALAPGFPGGGVQELHCEDVSAPGCPHDSPASEEGEEEGGVTAVGRMEEMDRRRAESRGMTRNIPVVIHELLLD